MQHSALALPLLSLHYPTKGERNSHKPVWNNTNKEPYPGKSPLPATLLGVLSFSPSLTGLGEVLGRPSVRACGGQERSARGDLEDISTFWEMGRGTHLISCQHL